MAKNDSVPDPAVVIKQLTTDNMDKNVLKEDITHASLATGRLSNVELHYCIKPEKTDKSEDLPLYLDSTTDVNELGIKPELECKAKQETNTNITELFDDDLTGVHPDHETSLCRNMKLQTTDNDDPHSLISIDATTDVAITDFKPKLEFNIKDEYHNNIIDSFDVKHDVSSYVMDHQNHRYQGNNTIVSRNKCWVGNKQDTAILDGPWEEAKKSDVTQTINDTKYTLDRCSSDPQNDSSPDVIDGNHLTKQMRTQSGKKSFSCSFCEKSFGRNPDLTKHLRIHTGERPFSCTYCTKRFSTKGNLTTHVTTHTGEGEFPCPHCDKIVHSKTALSRHMRTHSGEKPFACAHCNKRFSYKNSVARHVTIHTGETPFPCTVCDKMFRTKRILSRHLARHTGERPFSCPYCSKRVSSNGALKKHVRLHTEEKPFSCVHCSKRFAVRSSLSTHLTVHTGERPYTCPQCEQSFCKKSELSTHTRIHTGERPFSCFYCTKRFRVKGNLTVHLLTHTDEKPFTCITCSKRFRTKSQISRHMTTHR